MLPRSAALGPSCLPAVAGLSQARGKKLPSEGQREAAREPLSHFAERSRLSCHGADDPIACRHSSSTRWRATAADRSGRSALGREGSSCLGRRWRGSEGGWRWNAAQRRRAKVLQHPPRAGYGWGDDDKSANTSAPVLEKNSFKDLKRIGFSAAALGLLTWIQVSLDGRLGVIVEGSLGLVVQLLFAFVALDVSLSAATWIVGLLSIPTGLAKCPWCGESFKYDREGVRQVHLHSTASTEASVRMSCPSCLGELVYTGNDAQPFNQGSVSGPRRGFGQGPKSWAAENGGKIVDVEAVVQDKD